VWNKIKNIVLIIGMIIGAVLVGIMSGGEGVYDFKLSNRLSRRKNEIDQLLDDERKIKERLVGAGIADKNATQRLASIQRRKLELTKELSNTKKTTGGMTDENLLRSVNDMLSRL